MLTGADVRGLRQAYAPSMNSSTSDTTATEIVVLTGPIKVYGFTIINADVVTQVFRLADGTNSDADRKIHIGSIGADGELTLFFAPGFVRFDTNVRIINDNGGATTWTIFHE